jgi:hypothetical protein
MYHLKRWLILIIAFCSVAKAQDNNWNAVLNITPFPSPYTNVWEVNPGAVGSLILYNNLQQSTSIRLRATLSKDGSGVVLQSLSDLINVTSTPTVIVDNTKIIKFSDATYPVAGIKDKIDRTGRIPEGHYTLCLDIEDPEGGKLVQNVCSDFTIVYPDPPHLVTPFDGDSIENNVQYPVFQWTPVVVPPGYQLTYSLKLVEVLPGQTPSKALSSNIPVYENDNVHTSALVYPISALTIDTGKTYAWQVQALDQYGYPPTQNDGKSEIFTFTKKKPLIHFFPITIKNPVKLLYPDNNASVSEHPEFTWSYTLPSSFNYQNIDYRLIVVEVKDGQSPSDAIKNNTSYYIPDVGIYDAEYYEKNINQFGYYHRSTPHDVFPLPLNDNKQYAWQVRVVNKDNDKIIATSDIEEFTFAEGVTGGGNWQTTSFIGTLNYKFAEPGDKKTFPMANTNIKLVVEYHPYDPVANKVDFNSIITRHIVAEKQGGYIQTGLSGPDDCGQVVSVTKTDASGNFNFKFVQTNITGPFSVIKTGNYRMFRIVIDNPESKYSVSPSKDIVIQIGQNKNMGDFIATAKSCQLTLKIVSDNQVNQKITPGNGIPGMNVWLLRKKRPAGVPVNEGAPPYRGFNQKGAGFLFWFSKYELVAEGVTEADGSVKFDRVMFNDGPNDKYYIYSGSSNESVFNYSTTWPVEYSCKDISTALFSDQYLPEKISYTVKAHPLSPYVKGLVRSSATGLAIPGTTVKLMTGLTTAERSALTDSAGKFAFINLPVNFKNGNPVSPLRRLFVYKYGYKPFGTDIPSKGKVLMPGEKWNEPIDLEPNSVIVGQIISEDGGGLSARITVNGGESAEFDAPTFFNFNTKKVPPVNFKVGSTSGMHKIIIDPLDAEFFADTIEVNVNKPVVDLQAIKLYRKEHRLSVYVRPKYVQSNGRFIPSLPGSKIVGAKVQILDKLGNQVKGDDGKPLYGITKDDGKANFVFTNPDSAFEVFVQAPNNQDFISKFRSINNSESKNPVLVPITLQKATRISGHVYIGKNNQPVTGAIVRLVQSGGNTCSTSTGTDGSFTLHNVPIGSNDFIAGKSSSNLIGDKKNMNVPSNGLSDIIFNLKVYDKMDITHLMGFPIEVDSLIDNNGHVFITGSIVHLDSLKNNQFQVDQSALIKSLSFSNVEIVPDPNKTSVIFGQTIPVSDPATLPVKTDLNHLSLKVLHNYSGELRDNKIGIELDKNAPGSGIIKGRVLVSQSSFSKISSNLSIPGGVFYIRNSGANNLRIPVITATQNDPISNLNGFLVSDSLMHSLNFTLYGFKAAADSSLSVLYSDSLKLNTRIELNLINANPSHSIINLGNVNISIANGIGYIHKDNDNLSLQMDKWKLLIKNWNLNGYLNVTNGTLQTQLFNVPVTQLHISPTEILSSSVNINNISIGGIIPVNLSSKLKLNYNSSDSNWFLFASNPGSSVAAFGGLPGMASGDSVHISSIYLYSNQDNVDLIPEQSSKALKIYKIGIFNPSEIKYVPAGHHVEMTSLSFNIPGYPGTVNGVLVYYKENGQVKMRLVPFKIAFVDKGINYAFSASAADTMIFNNKGLYVRGRLWEEGKYSLNSWLYHTADSTSIWVETPNSPFVKAGTSWQKLQIGGNVNYFDSVGGHIYVNGNNWDTLSIAGNLTTPNGIKGGQNRITFAVTGEFYANNQSLGIKNISTPLGNMSWKYDFAKGQLIGTMDIDKNMGGVYIKGPAELLVDGSGWLFFGGITAKIPGLPEQDAAIIIGDYGSMPSDVKQKFTDVSYDKTLPKDFQNSIKGFLFSGKCAIPLGIPTLDINAGVAYIHFGVEAGANVKVWTSFSENGNEYGIGAIGFVHAYFNMDALTCTKISADATVQLAFTGMYDTNPGVFCLDGCGSISIGADIEQQGVGVDEVCTPPEITVFNKSLAISALMHIDSNGNMKFGFKNGSCSDNSPQGCAK